jgi:hypothetical protein
VEGNTVIHHVKAGSIPSWTSPDQAGHFTFDRNCLIIERGSQKLIWETAAARA